ncbi:MAG: MiaB/RimO family radical SAM methylthiotransferase, partial [Planctomycetes bacterium]|nr:MiaB/RimO family radical SAM methylthiotransferase [Planctomycetota bacterium]
DATTDLTRARLTLPHIAYLRVSEGCDRRCSFCAIPQIRGRQRSRPLGLLVAEAENLAGSGVKELCLVGEETTAYGRDLGPGKGRGIAQLLAALGRIDGLRWIRLLYAHPGSFRPELVAEIRDNEKVAKYVDMPIQHGDDEILKRMKRGTPASGIRRLVAGLRREVPGITLRTTVLVGFPGETERRFENLLALLEETRFERLGCFTFSREEGTAAHALRPRPAARVAARRRARVMALERRIIAERNTALVGRTIPVLIDRVAGNEAIGRSEGDAPDIDCSVRVRGAGLAPGTIAAVRVTGVRGYDLEGRARGAAGAGR